MEFRTLGPLDVVDDHGSVEVPGAIRRRLLCRLLVASGHPVPLAALERAAWGDHAPSSARRTIQSHLSRLRVLGVAIEREADGYRIDVPDDAVDAHRFRRLCEGDGLLHQEPAQLRRALGWWRGDAWVDLDATARVEEQTSLHDLRSAVEERIVHCDLAAGRVAAGTADAGRLATSEPRREARWALWAAGLALQERRADALAALHDASAAMADAGLDPGPLVRAIETAILADSDATAILDALATALGPVPATLAPSRHDAGPSPGRPPTGTITFLFTDVEGSTRQWAAVPGAMGRAMARHDEILRSSIAEHDGYVFSTAGDSFAAAFERASDAGAAALDIHGRLRSETWPEPVAIRVRMGLHTGTAELRDSDYFGPDVAVAARIASAGHGGQILGSGAIASLWDPDPGWRSLGRHGLSGFDDEFHVLQLGADRFPPIRTVRPSPHDLVRSDIALFGRDGEIRALREAVGTSRLVTIRGPGGIGKTALARRLGEQLADEDDIEVWWCDLAPAVGDVIAPISASVGVAGEVRDATTLARALDGRPSTVVVLDNCEHVVDAVRAVVDVLIERSTVMIVATSRVSLGSHGEHVHVVPPLPTDDDAVALFARTAESVGSPLDPDDRAVASSLCTDVDRIPLAIELVAARTRSMTVRDLADRVERVIFSTARGDSSDRHATMTNAIAWSVDLLDDGDAAGLGALSVFEGGFDLVAAEAVLGDAADAADLLDRLVVHSLVVHEPRPGRASRYRILEPIRQFAAERLLHDEGAVRDHHLEHYLDRLERAYEDLATTTCVPWLEVIEDEMDNLAALHRWALSSGRIDDDLRLYRPLQLSYLHDRHEPGRWATEVVETDRIEDHPGWLAANSVAIQYLFTVRQDVDEAFRLAERSQRASNDDPGFDFLQMNRAMRAGFFDHDAETGLRLFSDADRGDVAVRFHRYFVGPSFPLHEARARGEIDRSARERAVELFDEGLAWTVQIGARNLEAALLENMAQATLGLDPHQAWRLARDAEALASSMDVRHVVGQASLHQVRAALLGVDTGEDPAARLADVLDLALRAHHADRLSWALNAAPQILAPRGRADVAALCESAKDSLIWSLHFPAELDEDSEEVRTARRLADRLDVFEIARRARDALRDLSGVA